MSRNREIWRNLPQHLKYKSPKSTSNESGFVTLTMAITYMTFLRTDFQIFQMIEKADPRVAGPFPRIAGPLIETAMEILNIVSELALIRQPGLNMADCSYVVRILSPA